MNFEKNRQELLKQISQYKSQHKPKKKIETKSFVSQPTEKKRCVAIFGVQSLFTKSITDLLEVKYQVKQFENTTQIIDTCAELSIKNLIIDIDETSGLKSAIEIIGNLKVIQPETVFLCCTKDSTSPNASAIKQKGGIIIDKPVNATLVYKQFK